LSGRDAGAWWMQAHAGVEALSGPEGPPFAGYLPKEFVVPHHAGIFATRGFWGCTKTLYPTKRWCERRVAKL